MLIPTLDTVESIHFNGQIVLVIEKDSIFQSLIQNFQSIERQTGCHILLVTGKGYPCLATREFLVSIKLQFSVLFFGLFDFDPYGMEIFSVYKYGSKVII